MDVGKRLTIDSDMMMWKNSGCDNAEFGDGGASLLSNFWCVPLAAFVS